MDDYDKMTTGEAPNSETNIICPEVSDIYGYGLTRAITNKYIYWHSRR
jgi:hypothetical protein